MNVESLVAQSCPTLCNPMDHSLTSSSVHGIFQARILEWVAISFSRGSSRPRNQIWVSHIVGRRFTIWATREVQILEWVALPFSRGSSQPRDWTQVSCLAGSFFTSWATREAHKSCTCCYLWYIWTFSMLFCFFAYYFSLFFSNLAFPLDALCFLNYSF